MGRHEPGWGAPPPFDFRGTGGPAPDAPGPQPHNQVAGTFAAQLARATRRPAPGPAPGERRLRARRLLRWLVRREVRRLLRRELAGAVTEVVKLKVVRCGP